MHISHKARCFTESAIREMTRHAVAHGAVNLAQGFPDFPCPQELKDAACAAIQGDVNQYAITWGAQEFREALADKTLNFMGIEVDPESEITVTCGSTEAMIATLLALVDPGDQVVVFEPFYENYGPDAVLCGAEPCYVPLRPDSEGWTFDPAELRAAFGPRTRAVILNTPNNPTGKVFTRAELQQIATLCVEFDAVAVTDEIYEHILFDDAEHIALATLPGMRERTVTVNGMSKTYSVTGWRVKNMTSHWSRRTRKKYRGRSPKSMAMSCMATTSRCWSRRRITYSTTHEDISAWRTACSGSSPAGSRSRIAGSGAAAGARALAR